ncbi:hypothetical protein, conserved [Eimeria tenella]|uniref:Uncharacterized protein n=1 Tax=Eimeria tenella TaxID=5802 RepID=U6KY47_EIMTE|nr:hypothetical protein, conserved [Eimeria tenella]CDJ41259.1 hypothetical protein, conserved [Eimeria tenella]|eukprot:XP_013232009.1 hypothetical protein, conserved [Eimeria tenella]
MEINGSVSKQNEPSLLLSESLVRTPWGLCLGPKKEFWTLHGLLMRHRGVPTRKLALLLPQILLLAVVLLSSPACCRVVFVSPHGGPLLGVSASVDAEFAPWGPPVEEVVGQLIYKGSNCGASDPTLLSATSLDFRPKILRLSLLSALDWLATRLLPFRSRLRQGHHSGPFSAALTDFHFVPGAAAEEASALRAQALAAGTDPLAAVSAAAAAAGTEASAPATKGDSWRWAMERTGAARRESLKLMLPFSSFLWVEGKGPWAPPEGPPSGPLGGATTSKTSITSLPISDFSVESDHEPSQQQLEQQQQQREAEAATAATAEEGATAADAESVAARQKEESAMRAMEARGFFLRGRERRPESIHKRVWLLDQCKEEDLLLLIKAANGSGVAALLLTDTLFKDYSVPLLGNVFAPKPLMPVASVPDSPLLQQVKQHAAAAAAAGADPLYVLVDRLPSKGADCGAQQPVLLASLLTLPFWCLLAWLSQQQCGEDRGRDVTALHRLLLLPPALKATAAAAHVVYALQCPAWNAPGSQYIIMAVMASETLFQTLFVACILLISKGYLITRETLSSSESIAMAVLISAVYVMSSVSQVDPLECLPARLVLQLVTLGTILPSCSSCIRKIRLRLEYVRAAGLEDLRRALELKENMFEVHALSCFFFFVVSCLSSISFLLILDRPDLSDAVTVFLELGLWSVVAATFRPRRGLPYFTLLQAVEQQPILPMYAATPLLRCQDGLSDWGTSRGGAGGAGQLDESFTGECPILIVNPSAPGSNADAYKGLAVGTLIAPRNPQS